MLSTISGRRCFLAMAEIGREIDDDPARIGDRLDEDRLRARRDRGLEGGRIVRIRPHDCPAEVLVGMVELVDRAAVEFVGGHEFVSRLHERMHHQELGRVAGCDREGRRAALERGDPLLEDRVRRVADAGVNVAEGLEPEERGGVIDIVEDERSRLVDRRRARTGRGVRCGAGMDGEGVETRHTLAHETLHRSL